MITNVIENIIWIAPAKPKRQFDNRWESFHSHLYGWLCSEECLCCHNKQRTSNEHLCPVSPYDHLSLDMSKWGGIYWYWDSLGNEVCQQNRNRHGL